MTKPVTGTREEWLAARLGLLEAEKALTRQSDALARRRQELPWVRVEKPYRFQTDEGNASLADLFRGRSQLLVYHFMFGSDYTAGCPSCSTIADGFDGFVVHLANHDVTLFSVSRAPLAKLQAYKRRMGWRFPWASSLDSDFNFNCNVSFTEEQQREGLVEYNYRRGGHAMDTTPAPEPVAEFAATYGTDAPTYARDRPGMSAFVLDDGVVYHTYSTYARGLDGLWGMYQWLDRAPKGRPRDATRWAYGGAAVMSTTSAESGRRPRRPSRWTRNFTTHRFRVGLLRRLGDALRRQRGSDDRPVRIHAGGGRDEDARRPGDADRVDADVRTDLVRRRDVIPRHVDRDDGGDDAAVPRPDAVALWRGRRQGGWSSRSGFELQLRIAPADFSPFASRLAPGSQRTAATRPWRPGRLAADPAGSPTAPCADASPYA